MSSKPPARIDRAALDRILRRAGELESGRSGSLDEGLTEDEVVALGLEVGISEVQLRQAILEDRVRPRPLGDPTMLDRVLAPAEFRAERVVRGDPAELIQRLSRWLKKNERLIPQRSSPGLTLYEPMSSWAGTLKRIELAFNQTAVKPLLDKVDLLSASVTPLEDGVCHVGLQAVLRGRRRAFLGGGAALLSVGLAAGAILLTLGAPATVGLLPLVAGTASGYGVARIWRTWAERAGIGLERALDAMEQSDALNAAGSQGRLPAGSQSAAVLGREVGEAVRDFTREIRKALDQ